MDIFERSLFSTRPVICSQYPETLSLGLLAMQPWITGTELSVPAWLHLAHANFHDKSTWYCHAEGGQGAGLKTTWRVRAARSSREDFGECLLVTGSLSLSIPPSSKWEKASMYSQISTFSKITITLALPRDSSSSRQAVIILDVNFCGLVVGYIVSCVKDV